MAAINPLGSGQPLGFINNDQTVRTAVRVEVTTPRPTAEQLADAVFTTLKISETDRTAMKQANGGKDVRDSLAADFKNGGIKHSPLQYSGGGKYAGQVGMPQEMHRRLVEWSRTDGEAATASEPGAATKRGEVQAQGAYTKHKAELALRKQEAYQQLAEGVLGEGGAQAAGTTMTRTLPKAAPLGAAEALPLAIGVLGAAGTAVVLDKALELSIERQMEAVRNAPPVHMSKGQDEPPPTTTAEKPRAQPEIKVGPEETSLAHAQPQTPTTTSQPPSNQPSTPQRAPQGEPPPSEPPRFDPKRGIPTAITTAALGKLAHDKFEQPSREVREAAAFVEAARKAGKLFSNTIPDKLTTDLAQAEAVDVRPVKVSDAGFTETVEADAGQVKWAVTADGELFVTPHTVHNTEIKHSVLTGGKPVLAAGEALIQSGDGKFYLLDITNESGHFKPSAESLEVGRQAFIRDGVRTSFE